MASEAPMSASKTALSMARPRFKNPWIIVTALAFIMAIVVAFIVGYFVRSPNEAAISNSKNTPVITTVVEKRTLESPQTPVKGISSTGSTYDVFPPSSQGTAVVTAQLVKQGERVHSGTLLGRISGRPIIALHLPFSLYRDILPGATGDDVQAIQRALKEARLYAGAIDGQYGIATQKAIRNLYTRVKEQPPTLEGETSTPEEKAASDDVGHSNKPEESKGKSAASTAPNPQGTPVLKSEIVAIASPSAIAEDIARIGAQLSEEKPFAKLRVGTPSVTVRVPSSAKDKYSVGTSVDISSDGTELTVGTVSRVSSFRNTGEEPWQSLPGYDVTISLESPDKVSDKQNVTATVRTQQEERTGLAVPVTALREVNGKTFVRISGKDVPVTVTFTQDGFSLIEGALKEGDRVQIGNAK
ncbi:peptidoglycan-binding protein [Arcanobacterium canis]